MSRPVRVLNYYGSKVASAHRYPAPLYPTIIEPFAGGAGYSLRHRTRNVLLGDINPDVVAAWQWLIRATREEVFDLPTIEPGDFIPWRLPHGARCLIGFSNMLIGARPQERLVPCARRVPSSFWGSEKRENLAYLATEIKHWSTPILMSYEEWPDTEATWFIDPPYQGQVGDPYRHRPIDYSRLAEWCRSRRGQVIVCERPGATWLPFEETHAVRAAPRAGTKGRPKSREAMWLNNAETHP